MTVTMCGNSVHCTISSNCSKSGTEYGHKFHDIIKLYRCTEPAKDEPRNREGIMYRITVLFGILPKVENGFELLINPLISFNH